MRSLSSSFSMLGLLLSVPASPALSQAPPPSASAPAAPPVASAPAAPRVASAPKTGGTKKPRIVTLQMAEGLRFDPPRLEAQPGELLKFELENVDISHQPHNFVLVKPGQVQEVVKLSMEMGETGPNKGFIPEHPSILASSGKVVEPDGKVSLTFTAPMELGVYGYVCSVPGHGMVMYGALYVGTPMPPLAKDPNIPQLTLEKGLAGGGRRPFVQRIFMPQSGPASIAVALPGSLNYCFDAGTCRVRYVWSGPFLDGTKHWRGSGKDLGEMGDLAWWKSSASLLRIGGRKEDPSVEMKFLGYTLKEGVPEFHYRIGKQEVFQTVTPSGKGVEMRFRLPQMKGKVSIATDVEGLWKCPAGTDRKGVFEIPAGNAKEFSVFLEQKDPPPRKDAPAPTSQNSHLHNP